MNSGHKAIENGLKKEMNDLADLHNSSILPTPDQTLQLIRQRKSTRNYILNKEVPRNIQEMIIQAGLEAPSPKNRQPWNYTVLDRRDYIKTLSECMTRSLSLQQRERAEKGENDADLVMAQETASIIRQQSFVVLVSYEHEQKGFETADIQSIGASIQNMLLQAESMGIDSLWMCDVLYAEKEICKEFHIVGPLIAAAGFGYGQKRQTARKTIQEKAKWFDE